MPIAHHPDIGTILTCDFDAGFKEPEMVKLRTVVVISPKIKTRYGLCTVVALSTTTPDQDCKDLRIACDGTVCLDKTLVNAYLVRVSGSRLRAIRV